jgi:hypothetical protein
MGDPRGFLAQGEPETGHMIALEGEGPDEGLAVRPNMPTLITVMRQKAQ